MKVGKNVVISPKVSIYNGDNIEIGDNVRIDDFCILSGGSGIRIGSHIHISARVSLFGGSRIEIKDFATISPGCVLLSENDDFSGDSLVGPCVPEKYRCFLEKGLIVINRYVGLCTGSVVLPGVEVGEGAVVGALSLVKKDCKPWIMYAGVPAKEIGKRSKKMVTLAELFLAEYYKHDNGTY
jgi:dTDP-4-amino-4,6-dideoxy-D-glucose acyltransferase